MLIFQSLRKPARHLGAILFSLAVSTPAFAAKDELQVSNVNSVSVAGQAAASSSTTGGGHRQLTLSSPVVGAKSVSVQVTWGIVAGNDPRSTTWPNNGVTFSAETTRGAPISPITTGPVSCDFETASSTCSFTISFTTPNQTEPNYQIRVRPTVPSKTPGNRELQPRDLSVNFSVIQAVAKLDTTMTVPDPQCFVYGQGEVNLAATLSERVSTNPIAGRLIQFALGNSASGSAITGTDGQALWPFDISTLGAGDFSLYAEFEGDDAYNPSNDSGTFGVSYRFIGFQQPINADGTSVFGNGRIIPVKIKLADANLQPVTTAAPTVWMTQVSPLTALGSDYEPATSVSAADTGNTMRYVPEDDHYIFNWDLSTLSNGTWYVVVDLGDSDACSQGTHYATITVNKKKGK